MTYCFKNVVYRVMRVNKMDQKLVYTKLMWKQTDFRILKIDR